jgi:hypothetical protein
MNECGGVRVGTCGGCWFYPRSCTTMCYHTYQCYCYQCYHDHYCFGNLHTCTSCSLVICHIPSVSCVYLSLTTTLYLYSMQHGLLHMACIHLMPRLHGWFILYALWYASYCTHTSHASLAWMFHALCIIMVCITLNLSIS